MCVLAVAVLLVFQSRPYIPQLLSGLRLSYQALLGAVIGGLYLAASIVGFRYTSRLKATQSVVESYSRLDLHGWNPLWIAVAAGFCEELLFRGALQPLLGIWITSILFVLAHTRAYRFTNLSKRVLMQAFGIFFVSVFLGFLANYTGLMTAMIVHAVMDIAGLYTIRRVVSMQTTAAG